MTPAVDVSAAAAGRRAEDLEMLATIDGTTLDRHHTFHLSESYALAGAHEESVALLKRAVATASGASRTACARTSHSRMPNTRSHPNQP